MLNKFFELAQPFIFSLYKRYHIQYRYSSIKKPQANDSISNVWGFVLLLCCVSSRLWELGPFITKRTSSPASFSRIVWAALFMLSLILSSTYHLYGYHRAMDLTCRYTNNRKPCSFDTAGLPVILESLNRQPSMAPYPRGSMIILVSMMPIWCQPVHLDRKRPWIIWNNVMSEKLPRIRNKNEQITYRKRRLTWKRTQLRVWCQKRNWTR